MNDTKKGMLFIIMAAFFFASMNVFVKLSGDLSSIQKSFFRNLIAALFAFIILIKSKEGFTYQKKDIPMLLLRSTFGTLGILCNFYAVDHLLVSDASMLNKLSPFFVIIFSSLFLKETVVIAFIGSLFVIKPSIHFVSNINSFIGVLGAMGAGIAYTCVRKLGQQGVAGAKIVFFFSLFSCLSVVPYLIFHFQPMTLQQIGCLLMAGLMAAGGFFLLNQVPDVYSVIGYIIIIGVAFWNFMKQKRCV